MKLLIMFEFKEQIPLLVALSPSLSPLDRPAGPEKADMLVGLSKPSV